MAKVMILGAGSFGVALALLCHNCGHEVTVWSHRREEAERLQVEREQKKLLPGVKLPQEIAFTATLEAAQVCDLAILAVPSFAVRQTSRLLAPHLREGAVVACVAKGLEQGSYADFSTVIGEEIPNCPNVILSGPSHAEEVGRHIPTGVVAAAERLEHAELVQDLFMNPRFRVYTSNDPIGTEICAALKNVIALAAGIADGLGYGDNTKAALITRGIAEIARLGVKMGGKIETFTGLTGIGDLIVTCASRHSRNRKAGYLIGQGKTMQEAMDEVKMVVEGVYSAKAAARLAEKYGVSMPIVSEVNRVLFEGKDPAQAVDDLMLRESRSENGSLKWSE